MENSVDENKIESAEVSLLGNIIIDETGEMMLTALGSLTSDDFSDVRNRAVFEACCQLNQKGRQIEVASLANEMENSKTLDAVGGIGYLNTLISNTVRIAPVENYITIIKEKALLNRYIGKLKSIVKESEDKPIDNVSDFIGTSTDSLIELAQKRDLSQAKSLDTISDSLIAKLIAEKEEAKKNGNENSNLTGISTGYGELDFYTRGWHKGDMIIIGARPSVGKTALALNLMYKVAKTGKPVLFFSLEMNAVSIALRLLNKISGLTTDEISELDIKQGSKKNNLIIDTHGDAELASKASKLSNGLRELSQLPLYIDDSAGSKMMDIMTKCKQVQNELKSVKHTELALICIDYLGLIRGNTHANASRQEEVAAISRDIKATARSLNVPIIALSQLSRDSDKRTIHTPQMSDLRDSGSIEQDGDMIFMIYREDYYTKQQGMSNGDNKQGNNSVPSEDENNDYSQVVVNLIKNRNGKTGAVDFVFDKPHASFEAQAKRDE